MKTFGQFINESSDLTLRYHNKLNSKLWEGDKLKPEVLEKLIDIGNAWAEFSNIPQEAIKDMILVGGNANFNYTDYSDIDLHLLVNKEDMPDCPDLLDDFLKDKKQLWSLSHDISIYGHDVELYAQDINDEFPANQGVYSLTQNNWMVPPTRQEVNFDDPNLIRKINDYLNKIDDLINSNADDESFKKLKKKFGDMRKAGIKKAGEFSQENLIFKELRNKGYLDKMNQYIKSKEDEKLSLK
jgi:hypothetical protein